MKVFLFFSIVLFSFSISAQENKGKIIGKIVDSKTKEPIEYATIALLKSQDSSFVAGIITDVKGEFSIETPYDSYTVRIEFISYKTKKIKNIIVSAEKPTTDMGSITMENAIKELSEIEVTAKKSQLQMSVDKKVFNVEESLSNTGGRLLDVIDNIPSISVDIEGEINLRGSNNVRVLINGKLSAMSSSDVLKQLPANSIESIEIITNPSAKYDSEGLAGIINIILKKEIKRYWNGLFNITGGYPHDHSASANINYGGKKINFFANYSIDYDNLPAYTITNRETKINDTLSYIDQNSDWYSKDMAQRVRLGTDYTINKKNIISVLASHRTSPEKSGNNIQYLYYDFNRNLDDVIKRNTEDKELQNNSDYSLNYTKTYDKKDRSLSADIQYSSGGLAKNSEISQQDYTTSFLPENTLLLQRNYNKENQGNWTFQTDYVHPLSEKGKLETGYKSNFRKVNIDYDFEEYDDTLSNWTLMPSLSNHYIYDEKIHAVYGIYTNQHKKFGYQVGIRGEQTTISSLLKETEQSYNREYFNLFPSVHISREFGKEFQAQVSYSRRISRPSFRNLVPYTNYSDPLNIRIGNPDLNPEFTNSYEISTLKYFKKSTLGGSIYYRDTRNMIQRIRTLGSDGIAITKPTNLGQSQYFGAELTFTTDIFKWWSINSSLNYFRNIIDDGDDQKSYDSDFYSWLSKINSKFSLWKGASAQLSINYTGPSGTSIDQTRPIYYNDIGFSQNCFKEKGTLTFRVADVFNSNKYISDSYGSNYYINSTYMRKPRRIYLGFSYRFNNYNSNKEKKKESGYID